MERKRYAREFKLETVRLVKERGVRRVSGQVIV
jgi:hypothetical protein